MDGNDFYELKAVVGTALAIGTIVLLAMGASAVLVVAFLVLGIVGIFAILFWPK